MRREIYILAAVIILAGIFQFKASGRDDNRNDEPDVIARVSNQQNMKKSSGSQPVINPDNQIKRPLTFPIKGKTAKMILETPDSRLPGAPRSYRGANARHEGVDFYTNKCNLPVIAPADGWIIDSNDSENFPNQGIRDSILKITSKAGFTPEPILVNLHGKYLVIYHGCDAKGIGCYSRLSHLESFEKPFLPGDFVKRGEVLGYVGASGTSAQFKSKEEKEAGCHLHFEWHQLVGGEDKTLGFDERDPELKRKLYYNLFSSNVSTK